MKRLLNFLHFGLSIIEYIHNLKKIAVTNTCHK